MIAWGREKDIQAAVANVPHNWLVKFAAKNPAHIRKFGEARNATLLYRSAAVLEAVENGVVFEGTASDGE